MKHIWHTYHLTLYGIPLSYSGSRSARTHAHKYLNWPLWHT